SSHTARASPTCCPRRSARGATCSTARRPIPPATTRGSRGGRHASSSMSARSPLLSLRKGRCARARAAPVLAAVLATVLLAGCGLGAGRGPGGVQLLVTTCFGARVLGSWSAPSVRGEETVMSLLVRNAHVSTRYSGGFAESIDGV